MILDSNVLIYAIEPEYEVLRAYLLNYDGLPHISLITKLEVLGFHKLRSEYESKLQRLLANAFILPISSQIITEAIRLRQQRKRSLGDSIIAATGLVYDLPVLNTADFLTIPGLRVIALADVLSA